MFTVPEFKAGFPKLLFDLVPKMALFIDIIHVICMQNTSTPPADKTFNLQQHFKGSLVLQENGRLGNLEFQPLATPALLGCVCVWGGCYVLHHSLPLLVAWQLVLVEKFRGTVRHS